MTRPSIDTPAPDLAEIDAVYRQLGLTTASDRAYFASMSPHPAPTVQMTVRVGSTSLPQ